MQLLYVNPKQILPESGEDTFSFLYEPDAAAFVESVKKVGSPNPPVLRRVGEKYEIVCGLKRTMTYAYLQIFQIPAIVYDSAELSDEQGLWLNLVDGDGAGHLSPVEQAIVLQKFSRVEYDMIRLMMEIAPRVGLPQSFTYVENHLRLLSLEAQILTSIHKGDFGVEQAFLLFAAEPKTRVPLFHLLQSCKANVNETRELIPLVLDVAALRGQNPSDFIAQELQKALQDEPDSPRKRFQMLRESLRKKRYPALSAVEDEFHEVAEQLSLGKNCRIEAPKYFEGSDITITIRAANAQQLNDAVDKLAQPGSHEKINSLFRIFKGDASR